MTHHRSRPLMASLLAVPLSVLPLAGEAAGRLQLSSDAGAGFDSNLGNALEGHARHESSFLTAGGHADWYLGLNLYTTLLVRGTLQAEQYTHFGELSNQKASAMLRLFHRPGGGFFVPTFAAWVSAARWEFGSEIRDSDEFRGGAFVLQQLTTAMSGRLSYTASRRAADGAVFDLRGQSLAAALDWQPFARAALYLGHQIHDGDLVSTGRSADSYSAITVAEAVEPDDAFGGLAADELAYRLDARTRVSSLGINLRLTEDWSLDTQGQYIRADGEGDNAYERWIVVTSILARF